MRTTAFVLAATLAVTTVASAQVNLFKGASPEAKRANQHYQTGWEAMHVENWDEAAREFQAAIDADDRFALAYYSLGRAEMGRHRFQNAIAAYAKCKQIYVEIGGERFSNQLDYRKRLEDRILEYQTTIRQAQQQTSTAKGTSQSQSLYLRELNTHLMTLQQAKDRNDNVQMDTTVPYFVPMALGAAYFRAGQFADAEREYAEAIKANPGSGETHNNLAVLYLTTDRVALAEQEVAAHGLGDVRRYKRLGMSDRRLAALTGKTEGEIRDARHAAGVRPVYKRVDTCGAEYESHTPYMYSTYEEECEARPTDRKKVIILGGGPNRIGQGIEFDYCCVHAAIALREIGIE